jgi:rubrerythrin
VGDVRRPFGRGGGVFVAADLVVRLPIALAVIYVVALAIWYELIRHAVMARVARRQGERTQSNEFEEWRRQEAELAQERSEAAEQEAAEESEPDPARRHYYIARRTARAERDAAVELARKAVEQAIGRIERRHGEIEASLDHEESERIRRRFGIPMEGD